MFPHSIPAVQGLEWGQCIGEGRGRRFVGCGSRHLCGNLLVHPHRYYLKEHGL